MDPLRIGEEDLTVTAEDSLNRDEEPRAEESEQSVEVSKPGNENMLPICHTCSATFTSASQLKRHARVHPHSCEYCGELFRLRYIHAAAIHKADARVREAAQVHDCDGCDVVFKCQVLSLKDHLARKHTGRRATLCATIAASASSGLRTTCTYTCGASTVTRATRCCTSSANNRNVYVLRKHRRHEHMDNEFFRDVSKLRTRESLQQHEKLHERRECRQR